MLKVHTACDLNFIVRGEGLIKFTGSHIHCLSGDYGNGAR